MCKIFGMLAGMALIVDLDLARRRKLSIDPAKTSLCVRANIMSKSHRILEV